MVHGVPHTTRQREATNTKLQLHGKEFILTSTNINRVNYTWVRLFGYPLDAPVETLRLKMALHGELVSITDDVDGPLQIKTGIKIAQYKRLRWESTGCVQHIEGKLAPAETAINRATRPKSAKPARYAENVANLVTPKGTAPTDSVITVGKRAMKPTTAPSTKQIFPVSAKQWRPPVNQRKAK